MRPIDLLNPDHQKDTDAGVCTFCKADAKEFRDDLSKKEHRISGMCQSCQDSVFGRSRN